MYLRFICRVRNDGSGLETGVFQPAYAIAYGEIDVEFWHWKEIRQTLDWFNDNLDRPSRLHCPRRKARDRSGVCWFRPEAERHISLARYLAWLVTEAGVPVWEVRTVHPGEIVFRDDHQIVAARNRTGPVYLN